MNSSNHIQSYWKVLCLGIALLLSTPGVAQANDQHRLSLGVGVVTLGNPSQTSVSINGEYEYRMDPFLGIGFSGNYLLSNPAVALLAIPGFFLHPFAGSWIVSAAPVFQILTGANTAVGFRLGTRLPFSLGPVNVNPSVSVDFINGGENYVFGFGLSI
jgi:hypothetical protein